MRKLLLASASIFALTGAAKAEFINDETGAIVGQIADVIYFIYDAQYNRVGQYVMFAGQPFIRIAAPSGYVDFAQDPAQDPLLGLSDVGEEAFYYPVDQKCSGNSYVLTEHMPPVGHMQGTTTLQPPPKHQAFTVIYYAAMPYATGLFASYTNTFNPHFGCTPGSWTGQAGPAISYIFQHPLPWHWVAVQPPPPGPPGPQ